ncbi:MAG: hypothetical protein P8016_17430 [Sedimentisphaerales bacterium]
MNIAQLKTLNEGVEVKGFPLLIKTARNSYYDSDKNLWQEVVFMDSSGEMEGQILVEEGSDQDRQHETTGQAKKWNSKTNLCIMDGEIQLSDKGGKSHNKIVVRECFDTATPLSYDQQGEISAEQWQAAHESEVKSKIRCWLVASAIQNGKGFPGSDIEKAWINELVEFVYTGE